MSNLYGKEINLLQGKIKIGNQTETITGNGSIADFTETIRSFFTKLLQDEGVVTNASYDSTTQKITLEWTTGQETIIDVSDFLNLQEVNNKIDAKIQALDFDGVEGAQTGTFVKFVDKISQTNGVVSAELGELVFESEYNAKTNKVATMDEIRDLQTQDSGFRSQIDNNGSRINIIVGSDDNKSMREIATTVVKDLNVTKNQQAGNDGLALSITQTDGKIANIWGSIQANTYDAYGSALIAKNEAKDYADDRIDEKVSDLNQAIKAVQGNTDKTVKQAYELAAAAQTEAEVSNAIDEKIQELDLPNTYELKGAAEALKNSLQCENNNGIVRLYWKGE